MRKLFKAILLILLLTTMCSADIIPSTWYEVLQFKPIKYGVMENYHLPGHVFWVAVATSTTKRVTIPLLAKYGVELRPETFERWAVRGMLFFEGYQLVDNKFDPASKYGSVEKWFWDSAGDVLVPWWIMRKILYADRPLFTAGQFSVDGFAGFGSNFISINYHF